MISRMPEGIDYFNRGHWLSRVQARVSYGARRRMFELWRASAGELRGGSILDLGATPDRERLDSNCMVPWFAEAGLEVTLYSPEDIDNLRERFPFARIVPPAQTGPGVPVADAAHDWVSSSAVVEHVGSEAEQRAFVRECGRIARRGVFLTCPNRWHWLEFHTKLPLLHWLPRGAHRAVLRRLGFGAWARESHLRLLGRRELARLAGSALGPQWQFRVRSIWALGMPSNLLLLAWRRPEAPGPSPQAPSFV
jgi:hypothetical protein